ncbi:hypothetical protein ARALYDRAFT_354336 [Arabidopsis lyrata subsp. lyrata]|uniref:Nucleoside phosphorylase domain-containing protein n=1 Tax=Arabidopsis lyrata subsp. lyrata TaxID=81972 RepID=D7M8U8_ARALL|nr:hypothetical protein ARALYDRAFT_354336 [Arabidopsis lyrata subsp. lyrata]
MHHTSFGSWLRTKILFFFLSSSSSSSLPCTFCLLPPPLHTTKSAITIRKLNRRGPYIGLVTVFETEENAFLGSVDFRPDPMHPFLDLSGRRFRFRIGKIHGKKVVYVRCGIGMVNAAAATQQMIDVFNVKGIVHFGIAGNINNSMSIGDVSIPKQITNAGLWDWLNPDKAKGSEDVAYLDVGNYNVPQGKNELGTIGYSYEELYSVNGHINSPQKVFWINTTQEWLHLAADLVVVQNEIFDYIN